MLKKPLYILSFINTYIFNILKQYIYCINSLTLLLVILLYSNVITNNNINISFISEAHAELQEIREDWLCNDFGDKNCLFEDVYGCAVPGNNYNVGSCIDKDKVIDGNKCLIGNENNDNDINELPAIEIDGQVYVWGKGYYARDNRCVRDSYVDRDMKIGVKDKDKNIDEIGVAVSYSPEAGKIFVKDGKVGLVTEVKKLESVQLGAGRECYLLKNLHSCLRTCSSEREYRKVKKIITVKDSDGNITTKEVDEWVFISECDELVKKGGWTEWYACEEGQHNTQSKDEQEAWKDYCGEVYSSMESRYYFRRRNREQYLDRSCCVEGNNEGYLKYDADTYYKLDESFNVDDYIKIGYDKYARKSDVVVLNKVKYKKIRCLKNNVNYDNNVKREELVIIDYKDGKCGGYSASLDHYYGIYLSDDNGYIFLDDSRHSISKLLYKSIHKFSGKLDKFIKKYTGCSQSDMNNSSYYCSAPRVWYLKDSRCLKDKSNRCFLPQKETCLVNKHSKIKRCSLDDNPSCEVCVKWGIDLKEFSLDGFKNAAFKCLEHKTFTIDSPEFVSMRNEAVPSYTVKVVNSGNYRSSSDIASNFNNEKIVISKFLGPSHNYIYVYDEKSKKFIYPTYCSVDREVVHNYNGTELRYWYRIMYDRGKLQALDPNYKSLEEEQLRRGIRLSNAFKRKDIESFYLVQCEEIEKYSDGTADFYAACGNRYCGEWKLREWIDENDYSKGYKAFVKGVYCGTNSHLGSKGVFKDEKNMRCWPCQVGSTTGSWFWEETVDCKAVAKDARQYSYCVYEVYAPIEVTFECTKKHSYSGDVGYVSWMEPEFSMRDIEIQEIYDPNLISQ